MCARWAVLWQNWDCQDTSTIMQTVTRALDGFADRHLPLFVDVGCGRGYMTSTFVVVFIFVGQHYVTLFLHRYHRAVSRGHYF